MKSATTSSLVSVLVLVGCATSPRVETEFDETASFAGYKTFAILPLPKTIPGADPGVMLRLGSAIEDAVATSLTAKGYTATTDAKQADIGVYVHGQVVPKTEVTDWGFTPVHTTRGWHGSYPAHVYGGSNVTVDQYEEGTLVVEVYEVKSRDMVWVGWATARTSRDKEGQAERVRAAITSVLESFPHVGQAPAAQAK